MNEIQIAVRVPAEVVDRADALIPALTAAMPGVRITRSTAVRIALLRGLDLLEAEAAAKAGPPEKPPKRR